MAHLSTYIGRAALEKFFPHLNNSQPPTYNPQFNGWDSAQDMPKYNKPNNKNTPKNDYLKEGQKLNAHLIDQIFNGEMFKNQNQKIKPNLNQNMNVNQKNRQSLPVSSNPAGNLNQNMNGNQNQNARNNQEFYNKPIPYTDPIQEQRLKMAQTQYNSYGQYPAQQNMSMYPGSYRNPNQAPTQTMPQNTPKQYAKPQQNQTQNNENINQGNKQENPNFKKKISAEEMDKILSS